MGVSSVKTAGGLVLTLFSSVVLVTTASFIAKEVNVPTEIIGLSIVAVGTSIPELATSVVAAREGQSDISIGNVVGSNIFNILLVLGAAAIRGLAVESFMWLDMAIMLGVSAMLVPILLTGMVMSRRGGRRCWRATPSTWCTSSPTDRHVTDPRRNKHKVRPA